MVLEPRAQLTNVAAGAVARPWGKDAASIEGAESLLVVVNFFKNGGGQPLKFSLETASDPTLGLDYWKQTATTITLTNVGVGMFQAAVSELAGWVRWRVDNTGAGIATDVQFAMVIYGIGRCCGEGSRFGKLATALKGTC